MEHDHQPATAESLKTRLDKLQANRRDTAMRELMAKADEALANRTPRQAADDDKWGEAVHRSFENVHGYPLTDVTYDEDWLQDMTTYAQPHLTTEDLQEYAAPHPDDFTLGGTVEWEHEKEDEAGL